MTLVEPEQLVQLRELTTPNTQWAAFQNTTMDSAGLGHIQFLKFGEGCTYTSRPQRMPDTKFGTGWKYTFIGIVDLETGTIGPEAP